MIIFTLIRIMFLYIAVVLMLNLFESKSIYHKMSYALVAIPFIMRALLLK